LWDKGYTLPELGVHAIFVHSFSIDSTMMARANSARGKTILDHTPMGRFGQAEELIGTVIWLLSDAARFVTGVVVPVDGGFSAFSGV